MTIAMGLMYAHADCPTGEVVMGAVVPRLKYASARCALHDSSSMTQSTMHRYAVNGLKHCSASPDICVKLIREIGSTVGQAAGNK